jgi:hypothetical protein
MKNLYRLVINLFFISALFFFSTEFLNAYPSGISGATHKSGNSGCSCHGSNYFNTSVSVVIEGPDTLFVNQTATYTVTVSGGPYTRAGVDIAASNNNLVPVSTYLKTLNNELTHTSAVNYASGKVVFEFTYTAPDAALPQILYATGSSRKYWNFAEDKAIVIIPEAPVRITLLNNSLPRSMALLQNYPNPFNPSTIIRYSIPFNNDGSMAVSLKVYDILGNEIKTLVNSQQAAGNYEVEFNGSNLSSGVYIYQLKSGNLSQTKKMVLNK